MMKVLSVLALVFAAAGCTSGEPKDGKWGPLAVLDAPDVRGVNQVLGGTGHLTVDDRCVYLVSDGSHEQPEGTKTTLYWRSGQTAWDDGTIVFEDRQNGTLHISDGQRITAGGRGPYKSVPDLPWLAKPADSCPQPGFEVHSILMANG